MNEKCTFFSKITIRWNPTKAHATKLKSTKHKHVVKQYLLKMIDLQSDKQLYGLSYDENLLLIYQKTEVIRDEEVKTAGSYSKEGDRY